MPLETSRLTLRPLQAEDAEAHFAVVDSDPRVTWLGVARSREESRRYVADKAALWTQHGFGPYAVLDRATGLLLGHGGLEPLAETGETQLGYYLGQPAWGRGLATELGRAVLTEAFGPLGLARVVAIVRPHNAASQRVLAKLGFLREREGHFDGVEAQYWSLERGAFTGDPAQLLA